MEVKTKRSWSFPGDSKVADFTAFLNSLRETIISDSELREIFKKALSFVEPGSVIVTPRIFDEIIMAITYEDSICFITKNGLRVQFYVGWASLRILCSIVRVEEDRWEE
jgi:hypothetical protein